jgi:hypothetical protein
MGKGPCFEIRVLVLKLRVCVIEAFLSEVASGSREENASNNGNEAGSDFVRTIVPAMAEQNPLPKNIQRRILQ